MYIHTRGHLSVAMFWNVEFTRFQNAKTKRVRRLFNMSCISPARKTYSLGVSRYGKTFLATGARLILSHRGTIFRFALQNYTKKTTYARAYAIFLQFYSKFVIISPFFTLPVSVLRFNPKSLLCIVFLVSVISRSSAGGC